MSPEKVISSWTWTFAATKTKMLSDSSKMHYKRFVNIFLPAHRRLSVNNIHVNPNDRWTVLFLTRLTINYVRLNLYGVAVLSKMLSLNKIIREHFLLHYRSNDQMLRTVPELQHWKDWSLSKMRHPNHYSNCDGYCCLLLWLTSLIQRSKKNSTIHTYMLTAGAAI